MCDHPSNLHDQNDGEAAKREKCVPGQVFPPDGGRRGETYRAPQHVLGDGSNLSGPDQGLRLGQEDHNCTRPELLDDYPAALALIALQAFDHAALPLCDVSLDGVYPQTPAMELQARLERFDAATVPLRRAMAKALMVRGREMNEWRAMKRVELARVCQTDHQDVPVCDLTDEHSHGDLCDECAELVERAYKATHWHEDRAMGLGLDPSARLSSCGESVITVGNNDTGETVEIPVGCNQSYCKDCNTMGAKRLARKLKGVVTEHDRRQKKHKRRVALLTLTVRHSGDPLRDRKRLQHAWVQWRAWWHRTFKFAFTFIRVPEITKGKDALGHVHMHVVAWLPRYWDWKEGQEAWSRACGAIEGEDGSIANGNIDVQVKNDDATASRAIAYLTKYITKGCDLASLPLHIAAAWWAASYGMQRWSTSNGFWDVYTHDAPSWTLLGVDAPGGTTRHLKEWWNRARGRGPPPIRDE